MKQLTDLPDGSTVMVAVPSDETTQRLQDILSGSPVSIEWDTLCLQLAESDRPMKWSVDEDASYAVAFTDFGIRYDPETGRSFLVGFVSGNSVTERSSALGMVHDYMACVMFNSGAQLARTNKSFITSVASTLVSMEVKPFTFGPETLITG